MDLFESLQGIGMEVISYRTDRLMRRDTAGVLGLADTARAPGYLFRTFTMFFDKQRDCAVHFGSAYCLFTWSSRRTCITDLCGGQKCPILGSPHRYAQGSCAVKKL